MKTLFVLAVALAGLSAQAQTIYRCGPDGRSYSHAPCAQGRALEAGDERSAQQRQQAAEVVARERALGDKLARDRVAQAALARPAAAGMIDGRRGLHAQAQPGPEPSAKTRKKKRAKSSPGRPAERYKAVSTQSVQNAS